MKQKIVIAIVIRVLLLAVLVGGIWLVHNPVFALKEKRELAAKKVEEAPDQALEIMRQESEIADRSFDLGRIEKLFIDRSQVVTVVSAIEQEAINRSVAIQVPTIDEIREVDSNGKPIDSTEPGDSVAINISATGNPEDIVVFLRQIEHLPYLLAVEQFSLTSKVSAPVSLADAAAGAGVGTGVVVGAAEMQLILTVKNDR